MLILIKEKFRKTNLIIYAAYYRLYLQLVFIKACNKVCCNALLDCR